MFGFCETFPRSALNLRPAQDPCPCPANRGRAGFLWASIHGGGSIFFTDHHFEVGRREKVGCDFAGKQIDRSGNDVLSDMTDNTNKVTYIDVKPHRKSSDLIDRRQELQLRSVVGSLS